MNVFICQFVLMITWIFDRSPLRAGDIAYETSSVWISIIWVTNWLTTHFLHLSLLWVDIVVIVEAVICRGSRFHRMKRTVWIVNDIARGMEREGGREGGRWAIDLPLPYSHWSWFSSGMSSFAKRSLPCPWSPFACWHRRQDHWSAGFGHERYFSK